MLEPSHHTELIGVYDEPISWDTFFQTTPMPFREPAAAIRFYREYNDPAVSVELHIYGATFFWGAMGPDFVPYGVEFDPFQVRQPHTTDDYVHLCDYTFLNRDGTALHDRNVRGDLHPADDVRVLMYLRKFNPQEPILTPFRTFDTYTVSRKPDRLEAISHPFFLCPDD